MQGLPSVSQAVCGTPRLSLQKGLELYPKAISIAIIEKHNCIGLYAKYQHMKSQHVNLFCSANSCCRDLRIKIFLPPVCVYTHILYIYVRICIIY